MALFLFCNASSTLCTSGKGLPEHRYRVHIYAAKNRARCKRSAAKTAPARLSSGGTSNATGKEKRALRDPGTGAHSYTHARTHPRPTDAFTPQHTHQRHFALKQKHEAEQSAGENNWSNKTKSGFLHTLSKRRTRGLTISLKIADLRSRSRWGPRFQLLDTVSCGCATHNPPEEKAEMRR